MPKKLITTLTLCVCLLLTLLFLLFLGSSNSLMYEGKHLSEWLLLVGSPSLDEREQAKHAVREIGPNALPFLEELVENAHDSSFTVKVGKWWHRQDSPVEVIRRKVFLGYKALGEIAKPSVPFLLEKLKDNEPPVRSTAAGALAKIGPSANEGVPSLIALLNDEWGYVRRDAASALGQICVNSNDAVVIDALNKALNDKDSNVQKVARRALESVQQNADTLEVIE
jgi:HEAT repeat protein